MIELLAPAGNLETLETALYFGADAVYMAGKQYGLRAVSYTHLDVYKRQERRCRRGACRRPGKIFILHYNRDPRQ